MCIKGSQKEGRVRNIAFFTDLAPHLGGWGVRKQGTEEQKSGFVAFFFVFPKILFTFDPTNQIFLPLKECLVFIKKGEEIRLCETLATNPVVQENGAKT
jgi:hypothetical protein